LKAESMLQKYKQNHKQTLEQLNQELATCQENEKNATIAFNEEQQNHKKLIQVI